MYDISNGIVCYRLYVSVRLEVMLNVAGREIDLYRKVAELQIIFIIVSMINKYALCSYSDGVYEVFVLLPTN
jgi:hypothetical protein